MEFRRLGNSGLTVSVVGLGANNFGGRLNYEQTERVIRQMVEEGVNLIDTSNSYGGGLSEEYIGKAVKEIRSKVLLATKVSSVMADGPNQRGASRKHIMEQVEISLRKLRTDHIDLYQIHYSDSNTPIEETLRTLDDLVRQGKVRYIGLSNYTAWEVAEAVVTSRAMHLEPIVSVQPEYSMLKRGLETDVLPCCQNFNLGILPYFPLASGFLTGKYRRGQGAPEGTRLATNSQRAEATLTDENYDVLEKLEKFAADRGHAMVELAIAWLLSNQLVSSVISGATKPKQVTANARAAGWNLTAEEVGEVDEILESLAHAWGSPTVHAQPRP